MSTITLALMSCILHFFFYGMQLNLMTSKAEDKHAFNSQILTSHPLWTIRPYVTRAHDVFVVSVGTSLPSLCFMLFQSFNWSSPIRRYSVCLSLLCVSCCAMLCVLCDCVLCECECVIIVWVCHLACLSCVLCVCRVVCILCCVSVSCCLSCESFIVVCVCCACVSLFCFSSCVSYCVMSCVCCVVSCCLFVVSLLCECVVSCVYCVVWVCHCCVCVCVMLFVFLVWCCVMLCVCVPCDVCVVVWFLCLYSALRWLICFLTGCKCHRKSRHLLLQFPVCSSTRSTQVCVHIKLYSVCSTHQKSHISVNVFVCFQFLQ